MADEDVPHEIEALTDREPGADAENPYEDVDVGSLPEWWQKAIDEHREYGLRPYRPPRFRDGTIYPALKAELEESLDIDLTLICYDVASNTWDILVDGESIGEVTRQRTPAGYSLIDMEHDAFVELIEEAVSTS